MTRSTFTAMLMRGGMMGILYKTIVGRKDPAGTVGGVRSALESWCEEKGLTPVHLWPGSSVTQGFLSKIEPAWAAKMLKAGVVGLWIPNNTSANTLHRRRQAERLGQDR